MAEPGDGDGGDDLDPRETARIRHRERKRTTRMVVDNAGVRRLVLDRAERRAAAARARAAPPSETTDRSGSVDGGRSS